MRFSSLVKSFDEGTEDAAAIAHYCLVNVSRGRRLEIGYF